MVLLRFGVVIIILIVVFRNWFVLKCLVVEILIRIGKNINGVVDISWIIEEIFLIVGYIFLIDFGLKRFVVVKKFCRVINKLFVISVGIIGMKIFDSSLINVIIGLNFLFLLIICFKLFVESFERLVFFISLL